MLGWALIWGWKVQCGGHKCLLVLMWWGRLSPDTVPLQYLKEIWRIVNWRDVGRRYEDATGA